MKNMKKTAVATSMYQVKIADTTISHLMTLNEMGKNAQVLLQVASAMKKNKDLPKWADVSLGVSHFEKVLTLSNATLSKVCKTDSYAIIRQVVNIHLDGKHLTAKQFEAFEKVLTVATFQNNDYLLMIKEKNKDYLASRNDSPLAGNKTAAELKLKTELKKSEDADANSDSNSDSDSNTNLFSLSEHVASLDLEDALKLQALLNEHIAKLQESQSQVAQAS